MRVLVTGAAGFIGSHVTRRLLEAGHDVGALVRSPERARRLHPVINALRVFRADLGCLGEIEATLEAWQPDTCIHLAWYAEPGKYLDSIENLDSLRGSLELLQVLSRIGCRHVVIAGSCAEYGRIRGVCQESAPTRAGNLYTATKLSLHLIAEQLAAQAGFGLAWVRLFYVYGPGEDERRVVPALIQSLLRGEPFPATSGHQVRDYLHVEDVAAALAGLVERQSTGVFNVCSGTEITVRRLMELTGEIIGRAEMIRFGALPLPPAEPRHVRGDNRRLRRAVGWSPGYSLQQGLTETVEWWKGACASRPTAVGAESKC